MTLPEELKKKIAKRVNGRWSQHLKVCFHGCQNTQKKRDLFQVGYQAGQEETEKEFASFLEATRENSPVYYCKRCDRYTDVRYLQDKKGDRQKSFCYKCSDEMLEKAAVLGGGEK